MPKQPRKKAKKEFCRKCHDVLPRSHFHKGVYSEIRLCRLCCDFEKLLVAELDKYYKIHGQYPDADDEIRMEIHVTAEEYFDKKYELLMTNYSLFEMNRQFEMMFKKSTNDRTFTKRNRERWCRKRTDAQLKAYIEDRELVEKFRTDSKEDVVIKRKCMR